MISLDRRKIQRYVHAMATLYLIKRTFGEPLVLHPFQTRKDLIATFQNEPLVYCCSKQPSEEDLVHLRYRTYVLIDAAVDEWVQELKYIPRFIWSALAFLAVYLFTAFVIRIPVPLVDEIIFSSLAAAAVYIWVAKRNTRSDIALKRRLELKEHADQAEIRIDEKLKFFEDLFKRLDETSAPVLADIIAGREQLDASGADGSLVSVIRSRLVWDRNVQKRYRKLFKRIESPQKTPKQAEELAGHLLKLSRAKKADLPFIALYVLVMKHM